MAKCECCGRQLINQNGKCLYCGATIGSKPQQQTPNEQSSVRNSRPIIQRRTFLNRPQSIQDLRIKVTSPCFDNIGQVLDTLSIKYQPFDNDYKCDIIFWNCGSTDVMDYQQLASFVQKGGILYASDLISYQLPSVWPQIMSFSNDNTSCTMEAIVEDIELRQFIGNSITVEFDLGGWSKIVAAPDGKVLLRSANGGFPIMVEFTIGQGKLFYTSFHNHAQTEEAEKKLLQLLVIKQVASATKQDFRKTVESMPVSF